MANDAIGSVGQEAKKLKRWMAAGGRSGLNQIKAGGWKGLFGAEHLEAARDHIKSGYNAGKTAFEKAGGFEGEGAFKSAANAAWEGIEGLGETAFKFASGHGYTGLGRAGAIGARAAMLYGAVQAADFLNPFGFGSISD